MDAGTQVGSSQRAGKLLFCLQKMDETYLPWRQGHIWFSLDATSQLDHVPALRSLMLWCRIELLPSRVVPCGGRHEMRVVIRLEKNGPFLPDEYPLGSGCRWLQKVPNISIVSHLLEPRSVLGFRGNVTLVTTECEKSFPFVPLDVG